MKNNKTLYKVYCGTNGKWYTFYDKSKAKNLIDKLKACNFYTELITIEPPKKIKSEQISLI
jgi:hypothetical protein